jgi:hypothetical protein
MQASPGSMTSSIEERGPQRIRSYHVCITWILWPTRATEPPQTHVYTRNRPQGPLSSHLEKAQAEGAHLGVDRP